MAKMWAGRTAGETDRIADDFNASIHFDCRMFREDITGSMAHAAMLAAQNIIDKADADKIAEQVLINKRSREAAEKARIEVKAKISAGGNMDISNRVEKFVNCRTKDVSIRELYIVEGDSAGGSAKQARDRKYQAILPLRGKPLNAEKKRLDQVLSNEEFRSLITALGTSIDESFNLNNLKYHKVIILSDADQDGAHIRAILLTFFFRYMKGLIDAGKVYIATPPLYKISYKNVVEYAWTDDELRMKIGNQRNVTIQRYKGLGEMNAEQLWDTTMDPKYRTLLKVNLDDVIEADRIFSTLMGDDVEPRREFIEENAVYVQNLDV